MLHPQHVYGHLDMCANSQLRVSNDVLTRFAWQMGIHQEFSSKVTTSASLAQTTSGGLIQLQIRLRILIHLTGNHLVHVVSIQVYLSKMRVIYNKCDSVLARQKGYVMILYILTQSYQNLVGVQINTDKTKMKVSFKFQDILLGINAFNHAKTNCYIPQHVNGPTQENVFIILLRCMVELAILAINAKNQVLVQM